MNQIQRDNTLRLNILNIDEQIGLHNIYETKINDRGTAKLEYTGEYTKFHSEFKDKPEKIFPENLSKYYAVVNADFKYIGFLNKDLRKVDFGYNKYSNGDEYFGRWEMDNRTGDGIYLFKQDNKIKEIYVGDLKNDGKISEGTYIWLENPCFIQDLTDTKNFSAAIGNFNDDVMTDGRLIEFNDDKVRYYKGKLNKMMKDDADGFLVEISGRSKSAFKGKFANNEMTEGRLVVFEDVEKSFYYKNMNGQEGFSYSERNDLDLKIKKELEDFQKLKIKEIFSTLFKNILVAMRKVENENALKNMDYEDEVHRPLRDLIAPIIHEEAIKPSIFIEEKKEEEISVKVHENIKPKEEEKKQQQTIGDVHKTQGKLNPFTGSQTENNIFRTAGPENSNQNPGGLFEIGTLGNNNNQGNNFNFGTSSNNFSQLFPK